MTIPRWAPVGILVWQARDVEAPGTERRKDEALISMLGTVPVSVSEFAE